MSTGESRKFRAASGTGGSASLRLEASVAGRSRDATGRSRVFGRRREQDDAVSRWRTAISARQTRRRGELDLKRIYVVGTLDTKGAELAYLRSLVTAAGCDTRLVDVGIRPPAVAPDVTSAEVAAYHPDGADAVLA